jgi:hypothetical protein
VICSNPVYLFEGCPRFVTLAVDNNLTVLRLVHRFDYVGIYAAPNRMGHRSAGNKTPRGKNGDG